MAYKLTKKDLMLDLYAAFQCAKRHKSSRPYVKKFELDLDLHMGKLIVTEVTRGIEFLGAFVKPYRSYISNASLHRMVANIGRVVFSLKEMVWQRVCSWLGILSHYASYNIRCRLFLTKEMLSVSTFDREILKMNPV